MALATASKIKATPTFVLSFVKHCAKTFSRWTISSLPLSYKYYITRLQFRLNTIPENIQQVSPIHVFRYWYIGHTEYCGSHVDIQRNFTGPEIRQKNV